MRVRARCSLTCAGRALLCLAGRKHLHIGQHGEGELLGVAVAAWRLGRQHQVDAIAWAQHARHGADFVYLNGQRTPPVLECGRKDLSAPTGGVGSHQRLAALHFHSERLPVHCIVCVWNHRVPVDELRRNLTYGHHTRIQHIAGLQGPAGHHHRHQGLAAVGFFFQFRDPGVDSLVT